MSRFLKVGLALLASTALYAAPSSAADLDLPAPVIEHTPVVKSSGGFYLRGDIGYSIWKDPQLTNFNSDNGINNQFVNEQSDNAFVLGAGVGYKFKKYLRFDLTADIRTNKDIEGQAPCGCLGNAAFAGFDFSNQNTSLDLATFFANAYVDVGKFKGFTPYVGGGIGFAYLNYGSYTSSNNPTTGNTGLADLAAANGGNNPNPSNAETQRFEGEDELRFAWNLQAGASYDLTDNLALDGSYRYTRINDGLVSNITSVSTVTEEEDLQGHEFRIGLRYTFGGGQTYEEPSPIFK